MSVIIEEFNKPKNCHVCPFNNSDCYCNLTKGSIDRDDWDCSITCPIKTFEQEPFINKPCVSSGVCEHDKEIVLDKIKDEFISLYPKNYVGEPELGGSIREFSLNKVLKIIDKYKAESEK